MEPETAEDLLSEHGAVDYEGRVLRQIDEFKHRLTNELLLESAS